MATKAPALSTQLKAQSAKIEELEKKLKQSEDSKNSYYRERGDLQAEIEQVHALLDVLPGAAGRKTEHEESYYRKDITAMTRLASYLAHRG